MPTIPRSKAPSYIVLIKDAINSLKERGGCSRETILEYVAAKRGLAHFNGGLVNKYLREGVEKGEDQGAPEQGAFSSRSMVPR